MFIVTVLVTLLLTISTAFAECNGALPLSIWGSSELHWGYRCPFTPSTGYNIYRGVGLNGPYQLVANVPGGDILSWPDPIYHVTTTQMRYLVVSVSNNVEAYGSQIARNGQPHQETLTITTPVPYQAGSTMTVVADMLQTALPLEADKLRLYALHSTTPVVDVYVQNCSTTPPPSSPTSSTVTCSFVLPSLVSATRYEWRMEQNNVAIAATPLFSWTP